MRANLMILPCLELSFLMAMFLLFSPRGAQVEDLKFVSPANLSGKLARFAGPGPSATPERLGNGSRFADAAETNKLKGSFPLSMDALDDKHKLTIGDRLSFRIEEDQEDPKELLVTDLGELEVPYIGRFPAENKTCKQLSREIKAALEKEYYYQATVLIAIDVRAKSRGRVYLVGAVRVPGPQDIPSDEALTVSKAILRAGGFTDYANKQHVKITRKVSSSENNKTFMVDVGRILEKGKTENDYILEPGDLVYIPDRMIRF